MTWRLTPISAGEFVLYAAALDTNSGVEPATPFVPNAVPVHVAERLSFNPQNVLPVALTIPALAGLTWLWRFRRWRSDGRGRAGRSPYPRLRPGSGEGPRPGRSQRLHVLRTVRVEPLEVCREAAPRLLVERILRKQAPVIANVDERRFCRCTEQRLRQCRPGRRRMPRRRSGVQAAWRSPALTVPVPLVRTRPLVGGRLGPRAIARHSWSGGEPPGCSAGAEPGGDALVVWA